MPLRPILTPLLLSLVRAGDGRLSTELFVHWKNCEYRLKSELQLDADGMPAFTLYRPDELYRAVGVEPFPRPGTPL